MGKKILIMHGPNLNLLGEREPGIYGDTNFETLNQHLVEFAASLGLEAEVYQSNHEGALVDKLHESRKDFRALSSMRVRIPTTATPSPMQSRQLRSRSLRCISAISLHAMRSDHILSSHRSARAVSRASDC